MQRATLVLLLCGSACSVIRAHEIATHVKIGNAAVAYLSAAYQSRPLLLGSVTALQTQLQYGEEHEDDSFGTNLFGYNPYGRFIFHFTPALDNTIQLSGSPFSISAGGCSSVNWGQNTGTSSGEFGCSMSCSIQLWGLSGLCASISGVDHTNSFRWDQDLTLDNTGAPSAAAVKGFGYLVHLLEDLGSPPHTRNDAHPCAFGNYCDQFEKFNDNATYGPLYGDPQQAVGWSSFIQYTNPSPGAVIQVIPASAFTTPTDFFNALQVFTSTNYYSNRTVSPAILTENLCKVMTPNQSPNCTGPTAVFSDANYFYGPCLIPSGIPLSAIAGTCNMVTNPATGQTQAVRKIAHKGLGYWTSCAPPFLDSAGHVNEAQCDAGKADVDQLLAREQFAELGLVISQHVASFIQFYAPALTVYVQGSGTVASSPGNSINCGGGTCSALFPQGTDIALNATPQSGSAVTWGGACANAGGLTSYTMTLTADTYCTVTFSPPSTQGCELVSFAPNPPPNPPAFNGVTSVPPAFVETYTGGADISTVFEVAGSGGAATLLIGTWGSGCIPVDSCIPTALCHPSVQPVSAVSWATVSQTPYVDVRAFVTYGIWTSFEYLTVTLTPNPGSTPRTVAFQFDSSAVGALYYGTTLTFNQDGQ